MSTSPHATFELFPHLHTEIRLLIWEYHFSASRIHVLHQVASSLRSPSKILLNCTTVDAATNQQVPGHMRSDINHEAHSVATKIGIRKRIYALTDPVSLVSLYGGNRIRGDLPVRSLHNDQAVDVSWEDDLFYICSPESYLPFMGFYKQQWPHNIQHLALSVPYFLSRNRSQSWREQRTPSFDGDLLPAAVKAIPNVKTVRAVMLVTDSLIENYNAEKNTTAIAPGRDQFGFLSMEEYLNQNGEVGNLTSLADNMRVSNTLTIKLNEAYPEKSLTVEQCIDADLIQACDGEYRRQARLIATDAQAS